MTTQIEKIQEKIVEHDRIFEVVAEQIADTQSSLQRTMTELTSHFMRSIEPKIKLLVKTEVDRLTKGKG